MAEERNFQYTKESSDINHLSHNHNRLEDQVDVNTKNINDHDLAISRLKDVVYGIDAQNGLRGRCSKIEGSLEVILPQHTHLMEALNELKEFKKSAMKVVWLLTATVLITLASNFLKFEAIKSNGVILNEVSDEVKKIIDDQVKKP